MTTELFSRIADDIAEQGYCILDDVLPEGMAQALALEFKLEHIHDLKPAGVGRKSDFQQDERIRSDSIKWIDPDTPTSTRWLEWCNQVRISINRDLMMGLNYFESHFAKYEPGQFYARHVDAFKGQSNRVLSLVTYLNDDWQDAWGGELVLYTNNGAIKVVPKLGRVVIFLSEEFEHEVLPATHPRLSIAGWFRRSS